MIEGAVTEQPQSVREVVEAAFEEHVETEVVETPAKDVSDRPRDEAGRFAAKEAEAKAEKIAKAEKPEAPARATKPEAAAPETAPAPAYTPPKMPVSWRKELQPHWEKLPKEVHDEAIRRDQAYQQGVSTYKSEYDRLKPVGEALRQYDQLIQSGVKPDQIVHAAMRAHQTFTTGTKEQKLRELARYVTDYQVPLHELLIQGEDGKVYFNQQYFQKQEAPQPSGLTPEEVDKRVQAVWLANERHRQMQDFVNAKDSDGSPRYPHFETVKQTMDGLLRAGLAQDLPSAYEAALRHPNHSSLYDELNKHQLATKEAERQRAAAEAAKKAKANVVSRKSASPPGQSGDGKPKSVRDAVEAAYEEHLGR